jgi:uncharacterized membrane-anchored protein YhcB (DUF1043 family)
MEKISKKFWIIVLAIPLTVIGMFIGYLVVTYANTAIEESVSTQAGIPSEDALISDYKGGTYMDEGRSTTPMVANSSQDVIKTAYITMAADDLDATLLLVQELKDSYSAQTITLQDSGKGSERFLNLTIKVEESKLEELYNKIKELPGEFTYSSIGSTDVTETVQDLETRLENLQKLEVQYNEILKTSTSVTDTLAVQKELATTRTQIESIQTELKNLDNQTSYSYITLSISQSSTGVELSDNEWRPVGILKEAGRSLVGFAKFLGTGLIYVLVFSPVIAAVVVPVVLILKKTKK